MGTSKKKVSPESERLQALNFLEELSWLLDSNKGLNYSSIADIARTYRNTLAHNQRNSSNTYELIGTLPSLLKDIDIFPNNAQLVMFAEEVLNMRISRWEKRSRNELIGLIICQVEDSNKARIDVISDWSRNILNHKTEVKQLQKSAQNDPNNFSWNETINRLVGNQHEPKDQ